MAFGESYTSLDKRSYLLSGYLEQAKVKERSIKCTSIMSDIPLTPTSLSAAQMKVEDFYTKHFQLLDLLNLDRDACVTVLKNKLTFEEDLARYRFVNNILEKTQTGLEEIVFYEFGKDSDKPRTWLLFNHGGKIHPDVIGSSAYLPILSMKLPDVKIVGINNRGAQSEQGMCCYSLSDRITDVYTVLEYLISSGKIKPNDIIISFGDSMGGHVASTVTQIPEIFDALILTEPAAYTKYAQTLPFKELGTFYPEIPPVPTTFTSTIRSNDPANSFALDCVRKFGQLNKDILLSFVEKDTVLNAGQYFAPQLYWEAISSNTRVRNGAYQKKVSYPGTHGDTTFLEIQAIEDFILKVQARYDNKTV